MRSFKFALLLGVVTTTVVLICLTVISHTKINNYVEQTVKLYPKSKLLLTNYTKPGIIEKREIFKTEHPGIIEYYEELTNNKKTHFPISIAIGVIVFFLLMYLTTTVEEKNKKELKAERTKNAQQTEVHD